MELANKLAIAAVIFITIIVAGLVLRSCGKETNLESRKPGNQNQEDPFLASWLPNSSRFTIH